MFILGIIVLQGAGVAGIYWWSGHQSSPATSEMVHVVDSAAPTAGEVAAQETHKGWFYYATRDERLDDTTRHAKLTSAVDTADGAPAAVAPDGTLELRSSTVYGQSAVLTIIRRPSDASAEQATLAVRFDDRPPVQFPAEESTDSRAIVVAVADYDRFTSAMHTAHAMVVDAQLGARTERVMRFQVSGLNW